MPGTASAKRILVDKKEPEDAVLGLRHLPLKAFDLTVQQLRLVLQAFGKSKLSMLNKAQLSDMLSTVLQSGDAVVYPDKFAKTRALILSW